MKDLKDVPLSVLDLAPIREGGTAAQAFRNTLDLARHAEQWGYKRYWVAEHHNIPGIASAATAVVIGHVAGGTSRIRVGAGGVMLPNHAPLVIAEQFGTLASLYPGRIDLGLGPIPFKWAQVTASCYLGFAENRGNQEAATRMPRGQCTLPADETGRILDRLAGLEQVIRPEDLRQALTATGRVNPCDCVLTYEVTLRVVLAMGLLTDLPIRQVFKHARRLRAGERSPARSNLCLARRRLGIAPVRPLFGRVVRPLGRPETP